MKELYKFNVFVNREMPEIETREENGQTITTTKKVVKQVPIEFFIKEPNRSEKEEAEIVRATYLSNYIRRGVLPEAVLAKIYSDMGGTENEADKKLYNSLLEKLTKKIDEFSNAMTADKDNKDLIDKYSGEILEIKKEIATFQYSQRSFYENTAEHKAKIKLVEYLFSFLIYWKKDEKSELKPYFEGKTFEDKLSNLEKLENSNDEVYIKMKDIGLFVISAFIHTGGSIKSGDMQTLVKENFSNV